MFNDVALIDSADSLANLLTYDLRNNYSALTVGCRPTSVVLSSSSIYPLLLHKLFLYYDLAAYPRFRQGSNFYSFLSVPIFFPLTRGHKRRAPLDRGSGTGASIPPNNQGAIPPTSPFSPPFLIPPFPSLPLFALP